jgi:hypothetical protein
MPRGFRAITFVEVLVTISLLLLFAALSYPQFYSLIKGFTTHHAANSALEARLGLITRLTRLSAEVRPPYWENPGTVFQRDGTTWTVQYWRGDHDKTLVLSADAPDHLKATTPDGALEFNHVPPVTIDWWKKNDRIIGWQLQWQDGSPPFHLAWGAFPW